MKIKKVSKKKDGLYEILFDNLEKINLYDDVILKYELLLKREVDEKLLNKILKENSLQECYHKALKYVNSKLRTEKEIRLKLKDYDGEALDYTIKRLKQEGFLNDSLYIRSYTNDAVNFKLVGPNKIRLDLKKLGFREDDVNNYLESLDNDIWLNKIRKYLTKKINSNNKLSGSNLKIKLITDLQNKGFYKEDIISIISEFTFVDDQNIYAKEYEKVKKKLSKKYSGSELEYQIKNKMYQKGFKKQ